MPPRDRRHRRPRTSAAAVGVVAAVVVLVVVGGVFEVGRGSGPYRREVNRSYVAQGALLVRDSNQEGVELAGLMSGMPTMGRAALGDRLDSLADASAGVAAAAARLAPPAPTVTGFAAALAERAAAVAQLRRAVDGLLGVGGPARLTATTAAARVTAAGALLARADRDYARVRRRFRAAPGSAVLPRSVWVADDGLWDAGPVEALVSALASSPSLAPDLRVVLLPATVAVVPAAVPKVTAGGASVVPPTRTLGVSVVVADLGNVALGAVAVSARVTPQGPGAPRATSARVSLSPSTTLAVTLPSLKVVPGDTYTLTVSVLPPPGQSDLATTLVAYAIRVAPPTPPPTTTTTSAPATTTTSAPATTTTTAPPPTAGGSTPSTRPGA